MNLEAYLLMNANWDHADRYLELRCPTCGNRQLVDAAQMLDHLRELGMFKRQKQPDQALIHELYAQQAPWIACTQCGHVGCDQDSAPTMDDDQWGAARQCEVCGQLIAEERLEVFPDARLCTSCQSSADRGEDSADPEYCPRCGAIMQLRKRGGTGLAGYVMRCPDCGKTNL